MNKMRFPCFEVVNVGLSLGATLNHVAKCSRVLFVFAVSLSECVYGVGG